MSLYEMYVVKKMTLREIANELFISHQTVKIRLEKENIPLRNQGREKTKNYELIKELQIKTKLSRQVIVERLKQGWSVDRILLTPKRVKK
jgi:predicted transcriptional regulator